MTSGVKVADEVKDLYNEMKLVKNEDDENERLRVAIFQIKDGFIGIEKAIRQKDLVDKEDVFKHTMNLLTEKMCRYMLYDCHYETKEAIKKEELVFLMWAPDTAPIKEKMSYASSKESIRKVLTGIKHQLQVNDPADYRQRGNFAAELGKSVLTLEGHPV